MLDRLAPWARHFIILVVPVIFAWLLTEIPNWDLPFGLTGLLAAVVGAVVLWFTNVTKQYGVGSKGTTVDIEEAPDA